MSGNVRVRKDVWKLPAGDTTLEWYGKAIGAMKQRPLNDPTSWRYQAAIHDYIRASDPLATPGDVLPTANDQRRFWSQCQHGSWFFLPWHRIYLHYFEKIVAAAVTSLGGPANWALPYWNYSDRNNANAGRIPPAFRAPQLPGGGTNHLFVANRSAPSNAGGIVASAAFVDLNCLTDPTFTAQAPGGSPGFGGPRTGFSHSGNVIGSVERTPHGSMHVAVGGPVGWMSSFNTAALDPLFWLHHANIDRLWVVWRKRNALHVDPTQVAWRNMNFRFHDATGNVATLNPGQVGTTTASPLGYRYEDESDPLAATPGPSFAAAATAGTRGTAMPRRVIPEMVGATDQPIALTGQAETARMAVRAPTGPGFAAARATGTPQRIYLNIENITGEGAPTSYAVYLNLPAGDDPEQHPELFAGILPMFGVAEASRPARGHSGSGLQYSLDVGNVVRALQDADAWDPQDIRVTFVPALPGEAAEPEDTAFAASARGAAAENPIQVGRVSLYYA